MNPKTSQQHFFDVQLDWEADKKGILTVKNINGALRVDAPPEFGGEGGSWTPEHLFLSSIASCYMSTLMVFVKKIKADISGFECEATGQVDVVEGKYRFTYIHLYPKIFVAKEQEKERAELAMEKAKKYCLISDSINAEIFYHTEVLVAPSGQKDTVTGTGNPENVLSIDEKFRGDARDIKGARKEIYLTGKTA
jgi:peroxiredoxin-like protein